MKVDMVLNATLITEDKIIELSPRDGHFEKNGRKGYGSVCTLQNLSIDELVAFRDYLQTQVELRVYSKHLSQATREVMNQSKGAGCSEHPGAFCGCGAMKSSDEGFKL